METPDKLFSVPEFLSAFEFDEQTIWKAYGSMGPDGVEEFVYEVEAEMEALQGAVKSKLAALEHLINAQSDQQVALMVKKRLDQFPHDDLLYKWRKSIEYSWCGGGVKADEASKSLKHAVEEFVHDLDEATKIINPSKL